MIKLFTCIFFYLLTFNAFAEQAKTMEKAKTLDMGTSLIESNIRQPPTQITENPNLISITAKEVITEDFIEFENSILDDLKNDK